MDISALFTADSAVSRQNVAASVIKQSADQKQAAADLIAETVVSAPVSDTRGVNIDISV